MKKKRSKRIVFFGCKAIIFGVALIIVPFVNLFYGLPLSLLCLTAGIYFVICGIGILLLKDWARKGLAFLYFLISIACIITFALILLTLYPRSYRLQFSIIPIFLLPWFLASGYYLIRPKTKEQFK